MRRPLAGEGGAALLMTVAFMALAIPLITGALGLASTLSIDSRVKTRILKSQYAAIGGSQHALYRLLNEPDIIQKIATADSYTLTIDGNPVTVTILKRSSPPDDPLPASSHSGRKLQTVKTVSPATGSVNTTFKYTITVSNRHDRAIKITKIHDDLPRCFTYASGSTRGITTGDPIATGDPCVSGQHLTWDPQIGLQAGKSASLSFDAKATLAEPGNYCNEAWVEPGGRETGTGKTAKVRIGTTTNAPCEGPAATVSKTVTPEVVPGNTPTVYTYTITIENVGTVPLHVSRIKDLLPKGFLYTGGSTAGTITSGDPADKLDTQTERQRLDWDLTPKLEIQTGETRTLVFKAQAAVSPQDYWNDVWVTFDKGEFAEPVYTWPTALVKVMSVFETTASDGQSLVYSEVWIGTDSHVVKRWVVER